MPDDKREAVKALSEAFDMSLRRACKGGIMAWACRSKSTNRSSRKRGHRMGKLIDINEMMAVSREVAKNDREERERFLATFKRIRPILRGLKTILDFASSSPD
jgi:hypothetical protein